VGELLPGGAGPTCSSSGNDPRVVGRLPVVTTLDELDEAALVDILVKPAQRGRESQYRKTARPWTGALTFTDGRLRPSRVPPRRNRVLVPRGLRAILETAMLDIMYDVPGRRNVAES